MKRISTYRLLFLAIAFLSCGFAMAQPDISAKVDAKKITIGDQVRLFIEATPVDGEQLVWAVIPDTFNNLEVVEQGKIDTVRSNEGEITYKQRLLITGWDSGMYAIPPFQFTSVPDNAEPYQVFTDSFQILVQTVDVDTTKPFKPIKEILPVEYSWKDFIWYIVGGVIALGLIIFLIYYFMKNKGVKAPPRKAREPQETPNQKAMRMLHELEQKQLWQNDHIKQYYTELTDILRVYIEERFGTPTMELTTGELLAVAGRHRELNRYIDKMAMVLETADMAKFAKAQPLPQEHTQAFDNTKYIVEHTKPAPQPTMDKDDKAS